MSIAKSPQAVLEIALRLRRDVFLARIQPGDPEDERRRTHARWKSQVTHDLAAFERYAHYLDRGIEERGIGAKGLHRPPAGMLFGRRVLGGPARKMEQAPRLPVALARAAGRREC
jgi:hypothetical protein